MKDNNKTNTKNINKDEKQFLNIENSDNNIKTVNKNKSKTTMNKNKTVDKSKTTMNKNKTMDKSKNVNKNQTIDKSKNMNKSQTIDKSKTVDNSKSKNIINNKIIYKFSNNNNRNLELKKIERPGLQDMGVGKIITFEAVLVGKYRNNDRCYTIMNLHKGREYLADHTQLILNEEPEEFIKRNATKSNLIRATGRIDSYGKPNNIKYCINLLPLPKKIIFLPHIYYNNNEISFSSTEEFDKKLWDCYDKIDLARHDDLLRMIEAIRYKINDLTEGTFVNDFIYHFIINQYSLNTLNSDMYNNTIQSNEFDEIDLRNLVVLLGGVLYDLLSYIDISLYDLLEYSAYRLNKIQGIDKLTCRNKKECMESNSNFTKFCKKHYISFGKGWEFIRCRNKIFDLDVKNYGIVSEIENCLKGICYAMMI